MSRASRHRQAVCRRRAWSRGEQEPCAARPASALTRMSDPVASSRLRLALLLCVLPAACASVAPGGAALAPPAPSASSAPPGAVSGEASPAPAASSVAPVVGSASASAVGSAPASSASARTALANARRWAYQGRIEDAAGSPPTALKANLVELGQTGVAEHPVIVLAVEVDSVLADRELLSDKGLSFAPFPVLSPRVVLAANKPGSAPAIWLLEGESDPSAAEIIKALTERPSIELSRKLPPRAPFRPEPADTPFMYRRKVGPWESFCTAFSHPAPESGDTFFSERCYSPKVGLTSLSFRSVWGSFSLELVTPPASNAAPFAG